MPSFPIYVIKSCHEGEITFSIKCRYNFLLPISQVDENMRRAQLRDAVTQQKFLFRTNIQDLEGPPEVGELSLDDIFNGTSKLEGGDFKGLIPMVRNLLLNPINT